MPPKSKVRQPGKSKGNNEVRVFAKGDLVFAEVKGYPPWPARVENDLESNKPGSFRYTVFFFGSCDSGRITASHLYPYRKYKHIYGVERPMKKRLQSHFQEALEEISQLAGDIAESEFSNDDSNLSDSFTDNKFSDSVSASTSKKSNEGISAQPEDNSESEQNIKIASPEPIDEDIEPDQSSKDSIHPEDNSICNLSLKDFIHPEENNFDQLSKDSIPLEEENICEESSINDSISIEEESMSESLVLSNSEKERKRKILQYINANREKIQGKIESKKREKEFLKEEKYKMKIEMKRNEKASLFKKLRLDLLEELKSIDSNIKGNLSIGKVNIEESWKAFEKFLLIDLPLDGLKFYGEGLKLLLFTFKKCRKYKDDSVKDLSEKCYTKLIGTLNSLSKKDN